MVRKIAGNGGRAGALVVCLLSRRNRSAPDHLYVGGTNAAGVPVLSRFRIVDG